MPSRLRDKIAPYCSRQVQASTLGESMGRVALYGMYLVLLVQFLGGAIAFYRIDPKVLLGELSLQNGFFLGLFILIHLLGLFGAILALVKRRLGLILSIAHQLLMVLGLKIGTTFAFLTHDVLSFFVFLLSRFDEYSVTFRWSWGLGTIFAQLARDPRGTYIGLNLIALACAGFFWWVLRSDAAERAELAELARRAQGRGPRPPRSAPTDGGQPRRA